jgi:hypothetical protein
MVTQIQSIEQSGVEYFISRDYFLDARCCAGLIKGFLSGEVFVRIIAPEEELLGAVQITRMIGRSELMNLKRVAY